MQINKFGGFLMLVLFSFVSFGGNTNSSINETILKKVYYNISAAMGFTADPPDLKLIPQDNGMVAYINYDLNAICIEQHALDLCLSMEGKQEAAIALLLGHELAHFYFKHEFGSKFAASYSWKSISQFDTTFKLINTMHEEQADSMGGVFSFLAGYNTSGIADALLPLIYSSYHFPDSLDGYPVLSKRIETSKNNDKILGRFIKVFETANFMLLTHHYEDAQNLYEFLIRQGFNSREIYNNLGLAYVFDMLLNTDMSIKYKYPLEIDMETRSFNSKNIFEDRLDLAIKRFEQAIKFDPAYHTAYLNLACTYSLLNKLKDADFYLEKALDVCRKNKADSSGIYILSGILSDQKADKKMARKYLGSSFLAANPIAQFDLNVINNKAQAEQSDLSSQPARQTKNETIDGINIYETLTKISVQTVRAGDLNIKYQANPGSILYYFQSKSSSRTIIFLKTDDTYSGTTLMGNKKGENRSIIEKNYGKPNSVLLSRNGIIMVYPAFKNDFFPGC